MSLNIHSTAVIAAGAEISEGVTIGPYCVVGPDVILQEGVHLLSHVCIEGKTSIGANCRIYPFACIGFSPQYRNGSEPETETKIGAGTLVREHVTIHRGTPKGHTKTVVGDHCLLMVACHIAHDCQVGNSVEMANNATLAGHVTVGDYAIIGGLSAVHQRVRIGESAMIGGMTAIRNDVIPFGLVKREESDLAGLNLIGLKRRGFSKMAINSLRSAYNDIFLPSLTDQPISERVQQVADTYMDEEKVSILTDFIQQDPAKNFCLPHQARR